MSCLLDPSALVNVVTLIFLEIILGIDNIVFITILSEKLSVDQRNKARKTGLILAFFMRIASLSIFSWMITLTNPVFITPFFSLSIRDSLLLSGGCFLFLKALIELHEKLEFSKKKKEDKKTYTKFWIVVLQIVVLDAVFSIDSIITAVGMVNDLSVMIFSVLISTIIMFFLSNILTYFIRKNPTFIVLCLSFLVMIGIKLITESLGLYIPQEYLYAAISFSIFIEILNQTSKRNFILYQLTIPVRKRAKKILYRLILHDEKNKNNKKKHDSKNNLKNNNHITYTSKKELENFQEEEKYMLTSLLNLGTRSIRSIMTSRREISWINTDSNNEEILSLLLKTPHNLFPVCKGELDEIIGVVRAKEILMILHEKKNLIEFSSKFPPIVVPDTIDPIELLRVLQKSKGSLVLIINEFGLIQGLVTPVDVLEAIAGDFPDADETPDIILEKNSWLVKGSTDLHSLEQTLNTKKLAKNKNYASLAGLLISQKGKFPIPGDIIKINPFKFHIIKVKNYQINLVRITKDISIIK